MLIELPESTTLRELNLTGIYINVEPFCLFRLHLSEKSKLLHVSSDTSLSDWLDNHDEKQLLFTLFTDFLSGACSCFLAPEFNFLKDRACCPSGVSRFPYLVVPQNQLVAGSILMHYDQILNKSGKQLHCFGSYDC